MGGSTSKGLPCSKSETCSKLQLEANRAEETHQSHLKMAKSCQKTEIPVWTHRAEQETWKRAAYEFADECVKQIRPLILEPDLTEHKEIARVLSTQFPNPLVSLIQIFHSIPSSKHEYLVLQFEERMYKKIKESKDKIIRSEDTKWPRPCNDQKQRLQLSHQTSVDYGYSHHLNASLFPQHLSMRADSQLVNCLRHSEASVIWRRALMENGLIARFIVNGFQEVTYVMFLPNSAQSTWGTDARFKIFYNHYVEKLGISFVDYENTPALY